MSAGLKITPEYVTFTNTAISITSLPGVTISGGASNVTITSIPTTTIAGNVRITGPVDDHSRGDDGYDPVVVIDHGHYYLHDGKMFIAFVYSSALAKDLNINICFKTPDTTARAHLIMTAACSLGATVSIYEGATVTADSGTETLIINRERNSTRTSAILDCETAPVANKTSINATITGTGTEIWGEAIGAGVKGGTSYGASDRQEFVLDQNTVYAVRLLRDSVVGDAIASLAISWDEHVAVA